MPPLHYHDVVTTRHLVDPPHVFVVARELPVLNLALAVVPIVNLQHLRLLLEPVASAHVATCAVPVNTTATDVGHPRLSIETVVREILVLGRHEVLGFNLMTEPSTVGASIRILQHGEDRVQTNVDPTTEETFDETRLVGLIRISVPVLCLGHEPTEVLDNVLHLHLLKFLTTLGARTGPPIRAGQRRQTLLAMLHDRPHNATPEIFRHTFSRSVSVSLSVMSIRSPGNTTRHLDRSYLFTSTYTRSCLLYTS